MNTKVQKQFIKECIETEKVVDIFFQKGVGHRGVQILDMDDSVIVATSKIGNQMHVISSLSSVAPAGNVGGNY